MILSIKRLIQIPVIFIAMAVGAYCNTPLQHIAYAGNEIASGVPSLRSGPPRNDTPSPSLPLEGEERGEVGEAIQIPDVMATVNGVDITKQALERRMMQSRSMDPERFDAMSSEQRKKAMGRTIDNMVLREVIYQEAVKRNMTITDDEINLALENLKKQFPSEEAFEKAFADYNITISAWRVETRKNMMGIKLEEQMVNEIKISDQEIADFYEKNKKDINKDPNESLEDHKEHIRSILQQVKWQQLKSDWLNGLLAMYKIWKWTP